MVDSTWNRLNLMAQQGELSPRERVTLLLNTGLDVLQMDVAALTHIEDDCVTVLLSNHRKLNQAQFSLYHCLCKFTVEHGDVLASHDLSDANWEEYGVIEPLRFHAYIGIPIVIDTQIYGTLFFASHQAREEEFSPRDEAFLKMIATTFRNVIQQKIIQ